MCNDPEHKCQHNSPECENCPVLPQSLFHKLAGDDLARLTGDKQFAAYRNGETVFTSGLFPAGVYCLKNGMIKLCKTGPNGKEQIIRFVMPGELFGIRAVICQSGYTHAAVAIADSLVCRINAGEFEGMKNNNSFFALQLLHQLCDMLEDAQNNLLSRAQKPVKERLAEALLSLNTIFKQKNLGEGAGKTVISLSRRDLANLIGTAPETLIRLLSEFKNDRLIAISGRKITILNSRGLRKYANP